MMNELPNELLLHVLSSLDGASLVRCQRVCKRWQDAVALILKPGLPVWQRMCRAEIDADVLSELIGHLDQVLKHSPKFLPLKADWFEVYKLWYCTRAIKTCPHNVRMRRTVFAGDVTCLKATGDIVVTGHKSGQVVFWNAQDGRLLSQIKGSGVPTTDVALLCFHGLGAWHPWNQLRCLHSYVLCASYKPYVKAYPIEPRRSFLTSIRTACPVSSMRVHRDMLATLSLTYCVVSVFRALQTSSGVEFYLILEIPKPKHACSWIGINACCVTHVGPYWLAGSISVADSSSRAWQLDQSSGKRQPPIANAVLQGHRNLIFTTEPFPIELYVSTDSGQHVRPIRSGLGWHGRATALALWGPLLAIGFENGQLCLYRLRGSLCDLEPGQQPDWSHRLCRSPLVSVDITSDPSTARPTVVAGTRDEFHIVQWPLQR